MSGLDPLDTVLHSAERAIFDIVMKRSGMESLQPLNAVLVQTFDKIEEMSRLKGKLAGVPTGFTDLDELTNEGKLPKFRALLANSATKMQTPNSSSEAAKEYFGTTRPFRNAALDIKRVPNAGDAYDLGDSRDFPSGHSRIFQVYAASLAVMVPEKAPELLQRGADGAHSRAVLGVHSALGVMGGKAVGTRMGAQRLNDPVFYRDVFEPAMRELRTGLEAKCGTTIAACADGGNPTAAKAEVRERLTYGLPRIGQAGQPLAVPYGAEALLRTAHPDKTPEQRRAILAATAIDSGYPLDLTGTNAPATDVGWTRIDLAAALSYQP